MQSQSFPSWMKLVLAASGYYNIVWGGLVMSVPSLFFDWARLAQPNYPELWQCIGMMVGVYGIGYWIASSDPVRHWPIVFVGLLGKVLGPLGMLMAMVDGRFPVSFAWIIITNDLIWWVPFTMILMHAAKENSQQRRVYSPDIQGWAMRAQSQFGISILEHSKIRPVMLVFLRHVGCTFCREALADLRKNRAAIEASGTQIVLVHMGREETDETILGKYGMDDVPRLWDPKLSLYQAFGLEKGALAQLFGPKVWFRGFKAGFLGKHGAGGADGDVEQMPGVFLVFHGEILKSYRHQSAADRPNYLELIGELADAQP